MKKITYSALALIVTFMMAFTPVNKFTKLPVTVAKNVPVDDPAVGLFHTSEHGWVVFYGHMASIGGIITSVKYHDANNNYVSAYQIMGTSYNPTTHQFNAQIRYTISDSFISYTNHGYEDAF